VRRTTPTASSPPHRDTAHRDTLLALRLHAAALLAPADADAAPVALRRALTRLSPQQRLAVAVWCLRGAVKKEDHPRRNSKTRRGGHAERT
jgi:hypothetical protein